ncbi:MAG: flagellar biosynthesis protein FliQ [Thermodesulfovibrionales bacterium]|nr:flagellar biosynthesis protein FliQ [Thermodesulfovibrionales bacterium]
MTVELAKEISAEVLKTILLASGPILLISLLVGLVISILQAVTQIQEFTLTFVPKIIAVFIFLFIFFPWISTTLINFTVNIIQKIPIYIR